MNQTKKINNMRQMLLIGFMTLHYVNNVEASSDRDINATARDNGVAIGRAEAASIHFDVHNLPAAPLSPHPERERRPDEYFVQGETYLTRQPPSWGEALEAFQYAANVTPPHILACIRCAEYFHNQTPSDIKKALFYYDRALSTGEKVESAYAGLMKLHYEVGSKSPRKKTKEDSLKKAQAYGEKIELPSADEDRMLEDIDTLLSELGIGSAHGGAGGGSVSHHQTETAAQEKSLAEAQLAEQKRQLDLERERLEQQQRAVEAQQKALAEAEENRIIAEARAKAEQIKAEAAAKRLAAEKRVADAKIESDRATEVDEEMAQWVEEQKRLRLAAALAERQAREEVLARERLEADRKTRAEQAAREAEAQLAEQKRQLDLERERLEQQQRAVEAQQKASAEAMRQLKIDQERALETERLKREEAERKARAEQAARDEHERRARGAGAGAGAGGGMAAVVERPIPPIARGHEEIYRRFMNGRLVYKGPSGERTFLIADVINASLEGEFDLSGLTYKNYLDKIVPVADDLRIKLGYRKAKENESKVTVWLVPRFVASTADSSFRGVSWTSDVGIFWTWGKYGLGDYDYLTNMQLDEISTKNLYDLAGRGGWTGLDGGVCRGRVSLCVARDFPLFLIKF